MDELDEIENSPAFRDNNSAPARSFSVDPPPTQDATAKKRRRRVTLSETERYLKDAVERSW